jgi:deoxycytidylate deaminase
LPNPIAKNWHQHAFFHAESFAIYRLYGLNRRRGDQKLSLLSIRLNKKGLFRLAKPCEECANLLKKMNINEVYYSTNEGEIIKWQNIE